MMEDAENVKAKAESASQKGTRSKKMEDELVGSIAQSTFKHTSSDESAITATAAKKELDITEDNKEQEEETEEAAVVVEKGKEMKSGATSSKIIAFVNVQSGGSAGKKLMAFLREQLGADQVFDVMKDAPNVVMARLVKEIRNAKGDDEGELARETERLVFLVAGGDGSVTWVLSSELAVFRAQGLPMPPVAIVPQGTGNDLSRVFGWGGGVPLIGGVVKVARKSISDIHAGRVRKSPLDSWKIMMQIKNQYPTHMLPPLFRVKDSLATRELEGAVWNYFSVGMDASVAYGFHSLRKKKPWATSSQLINQGWYGYYGCSQGWFCTSCGCCNTPKLKGFLTLYIKTQADSEWQLCPFPESTRAIVVLNIQSYAGGRDLWGRKREAASHSDRKLEIVGLDDGCHSALVVSYLSRGSKIAQAIGIKACINVDHNTDLPPYAYFQIDGEPWKQDLFESDSTGAATASSSALAASKNNTAVQDNHGSHSTSNPFNKQQQVDASKSSLSESSILVVEIEHSAQSTMLQRL